MILLRQREFGNKENKKARKRWEAEQGKKVATQEGLFKTYDADAIARAEIQYEKNGARGLGGGPVEIGGLFDMYQKGKNWRDDVDPKTIHVDEDEILRRKFRDSERKKAEATPSTVHQAINKRGRAERNWRRDDAYSGRKYSFETDEYIKKRQKSARESIAKEIEGVNKDLYKTDKYVYSGPDDFLGKKERVDSDYTKNLKHSTRSRKYGDKAEELRKKKSLRTRIKEDLGIGMSDKAKGRIKKKNKEEGEILYNKLKAKSEQEGVHHVDVISGFGKGAFHSGIRSKQGKLEGHINAETGEEIAHELGHHYYRTDKDAGKVGKIAHKLYIGSDPHAKLTIGTGIGAGIASGINKAVRKDKGEKEGVMSKLSPALSSLAISSPMLVSEAAASRKGLKLLKEQGASRRYINHAKKEYAKALGSYIAAPALATAAGYGARGLSYLATKGVLKAKNKKRKEREEKEEKKKDKKK